jgi:hypothetical protein
MKLLFTQFTGKLFGRGLQPGRCFYMYEIVIYIRKNLYRRLPAARSLPNMRNYVKISFVICAESSVEKK